MSENAEWWRGCVIYQIYPRSFQDTTGDGTGDLRGVIERLPYVASLGVDAIWLSPFFQSPMADMGYDVSDYCAVDPMFGTMDDFDELVTEAHRLGVKIIIDQVLSHTSDKHPWFMESRADRSNPKADWYVWADAKPDGTAPANWLSVFGGPSWEWDSTRRQYYLHNFLASQPDLNFHNPDVQDALLDSVRFWLERGVDGFRLDTVNYYFHDRWLRANPPTADSAAGTAADTNPYMLQEHLFDKTRPENLAFLARFRALLNEHEGRAVVGEVGDEGRSLDTVAAYTGGGDKLNMCYTFDLLGEAFSPEHVRGCVEAFESKVADGWVCWAFSNHDVKRHVSRWTPAGGDPSAVAKFAISLLACLRGSICLYQGEELGMEEAELAFEDLRDPYGIRFWPGFKGRDGCRTPMVWEALPAGAGFTSAKPWLPISDELRRQAADLQEADGDSVLNHYREILRIRGEDEVLRSGDIAFLDAPEGVLAFIRERAGDKRVCIFNFSSEQAQFTLPAHLAALGETIFPKGGCVRTQNELAVAPLGSFVARVD